MIDFPETLIPAEYSDRTTEDGYAQIFVNPPEVEKLPGDITLPWKDDVEGNGLIIYVYKGKRTWITSSISKVPFSYLKKALNSTIDLTYLEKIYLIRGEKDFPLSDSECKTIATKIHNHLKNTNISSRISYTTPGQLSESEEKFADNIYLDLIDNFKNDGFDLTEKFENKSTNEPNELKSGNETITTNGLITTIQTRLKDENDPSKGLETISVRVQLEKTQETLLSTSIGLPDNVSENE